MQTLHFFVAIAIVGFVLTRQWKFRKEILGNIADYLGSFKGAKNQLALYDGIIVTKAKKDGLAEYDSIIASKEKELASLDFDSTLYDEIEYRQNAIDSLRSLRQTILDDDSIAAATPTFGLIVYNINNYLRKNNNAVADYHLMKDIVDRNCEVKEEEIATLLPFPLYAGLVGTMLGIIIGVATLAASLQEADLDLLTIRPLLSCVGMAMVASAAGIVITTQCSNKFKEAQKAVAKDKDDFLGWIQAELLPNVGGDLPSALSKMAGNLNEFNKVFSTNVANLRSTLKTVNDSYAAQAEVLDRIKGWKIDRIATANAEIYDKLKNSTEDIGLLVDHLNSLSHSFNMQNQNAERMATLLGSWEYEANDRKQFIGKAVAQTDQFMKDELKKITESADQIANQMSKAFTQQVQKMEEQTEALPKLVKELENLVSVRQLISNMQNATENQTRKLNELTTAINKLAQAKAPATTATAPVVTTYKWPLWLKILMALALAAIIASACLNIWSRLRYLLE